MATETSIANIALAKIREGRISSIEDTDDSVAVIMNDHFDDARDMVLEEHRWNFAGKRATLAELGSTPAFGWDHQYQLPSDYIRLKEVNGEEFESSSMRFEIEGDVILSNDNSMEITYVYKVTDVTKYTAAFINALAYKLAAQVCGRITGDSDMIPALEREYERALSKAMLIDAKMDGSRDKSLMRRFMEGSPVLNVRGNTSVWARTWNSIRNWP